MSTYTATRVRGLAGWTPYAPTKPLLEAVDAVFEEYRDELPLSIRQVMYRLDAEHGYDKDVYDRLQNMLNRARRSGRIPFEWIDDRSAVERVPTGFSGLLAGLLERGRPSGPRLPAEAPGGAAAVS